MKREETADEHFARLVDVNGLVKKLEQWFHRSYNPKTIYNWRSLGVPSKRYRGRVYFDPEEVAKWIRRQG